MVIVHVKWNVVLVVVTVFQENTVAYASCHVILAGPDHLIDSPSFADQ